MYGTYLSNKGLVTKVKVLKLNINLAFLLVTIIIKKIAKIKTSFLVVLSINLSNGLS